MSGGLFPEFVLGTEEVKSKDISKGSIAFRIIIGIPNAYDPRNGAVSGGYRDDRACYASVCFIMPETARNILSKIKVREDADKALEIMRLAGAKPHSVSDQPSVKSLVYDHERKIMQEVVEYHLWGRYHRDPDRGPSYIVKEKGITIYYAYHWLNEQLEPNDADLKRMAAIIAAQRASKIK